MGNVIENIKIYQYNGTAWNALTTSVDTTNNIANANVTSLSTFALVTLDSPNLIIVVQTNVYNIR